MFPLWREDNISFQELKKETLLSKATLSYMLDQLENAGHVERIHPKEDKRTVRIKLIKMNENLKEKFIRVSDQMKGVFYEGFSESEIDTFEEYLKRIMNNLTHYKKKEI